MLNLISTALVVGPFAGSFNFIHFVVGLILLMCVIAILVVLVRWVATLAGITIPPQLMLVLGILVFMILFVMLLNWAGLNIW